MTALPEILVLVFEGSEPVVIANSEGKRTTPSVVGFVKDGDRKVGDLQNGCLMSNLKHPLYPITHRPPADIRLHNRWWTSAYQLLCKRTTAVVRLKI